MTLQGGWPATGLALAAVAALMLVGRIPGAYHELQHAAKAAAGRNELGGALATADSLSVNDDFVRNAFAIPTGGRIAVPARTDGDRAGGRCKSDHVRRHAALFEVYLLPRREVKTRRRFDLRHLLLLQHCRPRSGRALARP